MSPMIPPEVAPTLALLLGLFLVSFLFSGTETAFFSLQEIDRRRIAEGSSPNDRRIQRLLASRPSLITSILMGNESANVAISTTTAALVVLVAPQHPWITVVVITPLLVLLSEITPKTIAFRHATTWVRWAAWPLAAVQTALWPLRALLDLLVGSMARGFGVTPAPQSSGMAEEEFLVLVERGAAQGVVREDQRDIITAVFGLDDMTIARLMTPRPEMFSLPIDTPWFDLLDACRISRYSRIPIWEDHPENIIGVLLVKDLLRFRRKPLQDPEALRSLLLPPVFVPGSKPADEMMREMIRRRIHMAFVLDEHGTIIGLITLDDLIMELVGELSDDDTEDEPASIEPLPGGAFLVRASVDLEDLEDHTGLGLPSDEAHTLNGWIFHELGRVPESGEVIDAGDHTLEVVEADHRRVSSVLIQPQAPPQEGS